MQLYGILQILLATAFAFSILMRTVNNIANPMYQLSLMADKLSKGKFDLPDIHFNSVTEVNQVAEAFNDMKLNIRHYVDELHKQKAIEQQVLTEKYRNLEMEQILKRMELYTMQAQMNPHFLFNTINTGVQLAIMEDADRTLNSLVFTERSVVKIQCSDWLCAFSGFLKQQLLFNSIYLYVRFCFSSNSISGKTTKLCTSR